MLLAEVFSSATPVALGLVITLVALGGGIFVSVLTSRLMQGRSIRELEDDVKELNRWRKQDVTPQLNTLVNARVIDEKVAVAVAAAKRESASQSTTHGTQPYRKANR